MINKGLFSSNTNEWSTPQDLFDELDKEFRFDLDPCATDENAKCSEHFTKEQDGLSKTWYGSVFMNPPYGREIGKWVKKAYEEAQKHANVVVCLIPARTDTAYWHDYCMRGEIRFIRGRVKFGDSKQGAPFPSAIVIFKEEG